MNCERFLKVMVILCVRPNSGSSHYTFRKPGKMPITIPKHEPIKKVYVQMVKEVIENGEE